MERHGAIPGKLGHFTCRLGAYYDSLALRRKIGDTHLRFSAFLLTV